MKNGVKQLVVTAITVPIADAIISKIYAELDYNEMIKKGEIISAFIWHPILYLTHDGKEVKFKEGSR